MLLGDWRDVIGMGAPWNVLEVCEGDGVGSSEGRVTSALRNAVAQPGSFRRVWGF